MSSSNRRATTDNRMFLSRLDALNTADTCLQCCEMTSTEVHFAVNVPTVFATKRIPEIHSTDNRVLVLIVAN